MSGGQPLSHWKREATQVSRLSFWNSDKDARRRIAFDRLGDIGEPAVPVLVDLFRREPAPISGDAFNALASLGPRAAGAVPELLEMLDGDRPELRVRAVWLLGTIGAPAAPAVPRLTRLLQDQDPGLRQVTARALGQIGGGGNAALERARTSGNVGEREASLAEMATRPLDPDSRRRIVGAGLADASPDVRTRAVELIGTASGAEAEVLAEYLVRALNDPDPRVNRAAHEALGASRQRGGATPRLLAAVLRGGDAAARADAAWSLGNRATAPGHSDRGDPVVVNALLAGLRDGDAKVRIYAGRALALGSGDAREEGIQALRRDMRSVEPILGVRAARALWEVARDAAEVRPVYLAGLGEAETWKRVETISAIAAMGKDAASFVPQLERLLHEGEPEVQEHAANALYAITLRRPSRAAPRLSPAPPPRLEPE